MDEDDGYYLSEVTGKKYPKYLYANHGYGGMKGKWKDLPHDEYPYLEIDPPKEQPKFFPKGPERTISRVTKRCPFSSTEKEDIFCVFYIIE